MKIDLQCLQDFPLVKEGDDLLSLITENLEQNNLSLSNGDVIVLAQKIVSKAEGRMVELKHVTPSEEAKVLAEECEKDPRIVELILQESTQVVRKVPGVIIVRHKLGLVMANAGIDQSNVRGKNDEVLLLPVDPDKSAQQLKQGLDKHFGIELNVIINDSFGRPFRQGTAGVCIGSAGFTALEIKTGGKDLFGRELMNTEVAVADEIAAAASLLMGQADEGCPLVVVKGLNLQKSTEGSATLLRPLERDLFIGKQ